MHMRIVVTGYILLILIFSSVPTLAVTAQNPSVPYWNNEWSYRNEITVPSATDSAFAKYQPIDLRVHFDHCCWAKNENEHSIRVCCWDRGRWQELESQIYDLQFTDANHIDECSLVFLIPETADGAETYYVYYDDDGKPAPHYMDHVNVEDAYYHYTPLAELTAEATYYGINEDGYCLYGVGQSGEFLDQSLSQVVVKLQNGVESFDMLKAEQIASFAFSYYYGPREEDELASDRAFVSKKIFVDGNLMVKFGIISESAEGELRTTAIYTYYYTPHENKRICVHVKHEVLHEAVVVAGKENLDGRYGALIAFRSENIRIERLNFGDIQPFLHFFGENDNIEQYPMNPDPESKDHEWIVSFQDDADLGSESWIAHGEGEHGKSHAVIFASNMGIVRSGNAERDGIQLKVAEREYFDFLGTEVDYATINFGRNSYEKGSTHDLDIPKDLVVAFDAELFATEAGGYPAVQQEAAVYQTLVHHRYPSEYAAFEQELKNYDLTVVSHLGGTQFSFPRLANKTRFSFPVMWFEVYRDGSLIASGTGNRSFFTRAYKTFHDLTAGTYLIKVYHMFSNATKFFNGAHVVTLERDTTVHVFCTWQRVIRLMVSDQNNQGIEGVTVFLLSNDDIIFDSNTTDSTGETVLKAPYRFRDAYRVEAYYRDFLVYEEELKQSLRNLDLHFAIGLYDITVEVQDTLGLPPGVAIQPVLISTTFANTSAILPAETEPGRFVVEHIPAGEYTLQISYASFLDETLVQVPGDGDVVTLTFSAVFDLGVALFDSQGNPLSEEPITLKIFRDGRQIGDSNGDERRFTLPPARYTVEAYENSNVVGLKEVDLTSDRTIKILTTVSSIIPTLIVAASLLLIGILVVLSLLRKLSLTSFLKIVAIALIVVALTQPWWELSGSSQVPEAERTVDMYMQPQVMIESTTVDGSTTYDLAAMPDIFVDLLRNLVIVAYATCVILALGFLFHKLGRKKVALLLVFFSILLLVVVLGMYYMGTAKLSEASIGSIQGESMLSFTVDDISLVLLSRWGLGIGFYVVALSLVVTLLTGIIEIRYFFLGKNDRQKRKA